MTYTMLDTITPGAAEHVASTSFEAVAGYVAGSWPDYDEMARLFPKDHHLSITPRPDIDADCLDIETGDAEPHDAPAWVKRQHARGLVYPVLYANLSTMPQVTAELGAAGIPRTSYKLWVAEYTYVAHIPEGYDACQWTNHYMGQNLDASDCLDSFFLPTVPSTAAPKPEVKKPKPKKPSKVKAAAKKVKAAPKKAAKVAAKKVAAVHPKVAASTLGAIVTAAITTVLTKDAHVHLTSEDVKGITAAVVFACGYLTPQGKTAVEAAANDVDAS